MSLGRQGEIWAWEHYLQQGYTGVDRNAFNRRGKQLGEIDLVVRKARTLVFVEVKTRMAGPNRFGTGLEAVDRFKQKKLVRAVKSYLLTHPFFQDLTPRIDVCAIEVSDVDKKRYCVKILENAVEDWS